jgi:large subunit ribosomal protein L10
MSTKQERTQTIEKLETEFREAGGIYLTDINRISVEKISKLRVNFRKKGIKYLVIKNTLAKKAFERCGKKDVIPYLKGTIGVALSKSEPLSPAAIIKDFQKENKDLLEIKVAYVDGTLFSTKDAVRLADIPPRDVLIAQLLGCLQAPIANMAGVLNGVLVKFAGTLESVKKQKETATN